MKTRLTLTAAIVSVLASTSAFAVDLSTTIGNTVTNSTTTVNQHVTGQTNGFEVNYSQNRGGVVDAANPCTGGACDGNDMLSVGVSVDVTKRIGSIDQLTTGINTSTAANCDVTVSIGGLSNSQGVRTVDTLSSLETQNNNTVTIQTASIEVTTQTDAGYTGGHWNPSKPGNDFTVNVGDMTINSEGNSLNLIELGNTMLTTDLGTVTVSGQDFAHADTNAMSIKIDTSDLDVIDTGVTVTETTGTTTTHYENN